MKTHKQLWLGLLIGLAIGYAAGVMMMFQTRHQEVRKQSMESSELGAARARLAELRMTFTDQSTWVRSQLDKVHQLEQREHKL